LLAALAGAGRGFFNPSIISASFSGEGGRLPPEQLLDVVRRYAGFREDVQELAPAPKPPGVPACQFARERSDPAAQLAFNRPRQAEQLRLEVPRLTGLPRLLLVSGGRL
jgi:hypothetical protein